MSQTADNDKNKPALPDKGDATKPAVNKPADPITEGSQLQAQELLTSIGKMLEATKQKNQADKDDPAPAAEPETKKDKNTDAAQDWAKALGLEENTDTYNTFNEMLQHTQKGAAAAALVEVQKSVRPVVQQVIQQELDQVFAKRDFLTKFNISPEHEQAVQQLYELNRQANPEAQPKDIYDAVALLVQQWTSVRSKKADEPVDAGDAALRGLFTIKKEV